MGNAVVYLLNNNLNYLKMASKSMYMLRSFNDEIKIICLCTSKINLPDFLDVELIEIKDLDPDYIHVNRQYMGDIECENILYVDSDTFIFDDVQKIFDYYDKDFVGCENTWAYKQNFNLFKPTNGGVLLFKNFAHKKIYEDFSYKLKHMNILYKDVWDWMSSINNLYVREEFLISSIAEEQKIKRCFFERHHVKIPEDYKDIKNINTIIFHTFTSNWSVFSREISSNKIKKIKPRLI
jgi:hypothetical protein